MNFQTFLELIREFGPSIIMFAFGLWGVYQMRIKNDKNEERIQKKEDDLMNFFQTALDKHDLEKQKKHDAGVEYRKNMIYKCNQYATELLKLTNADHVAIYDYCNGTSNLSGIPFVNFKIISEKRNSINIKSVFEKTEINTLGVFLLDLEKEKNIIIKNINKEESKYPELGCFMKLNKQYKGLFINLVGVSSSLGFISITFNHNKKIDYKELDKIVYDYTHKIAHLLDYTNNFS